MLVSNGFALISEKSQEGSEHKWGVRTHSFPRGDATGKRANNNDNDVDDDDDDNDIRCDYVINVQKSVSENVSEIGQRPRLFLISELHAEL